MCTHAYMCCIFVCPFLLSVWQVAEVGCDGDGKEDKSCASLVLCVDLGDESRSMHMESK